MTKEDNFTDLDKAYDFIDWEISNEDFDKILDMPNQKRIQWLQEYNYHDKPTSTSFLEALSDPVYQ